MGELERILFRYEAVSRAGRTAALVSVVGARGSTYRRIGAHMLLTEDGDVMGAISGGCLERDVRRHAIWVIQTGQAKHLVYDSSSDDDAAEDAFALGCNGVIEVLVERLLPGDPYMAFLARCVRESRCGVVATVFAGEPGAGIETGGRLLWRERTMPLVLGMDDGEHTRVLAEGARRVFASGRSTTGTVDMGSGRAAVCFEIVEPPPRLAIFGGGDDAVPVATLASALGMRVTVVDPRPGYATRARFPDADRLMAVRPQDAVEALTLDGKSLAAVMNHNYHQDLEALEALLPLTIRYLGVLGPKRRTERLLADLQARGFAVTQTQLARLHSPVGLDLGAETHEEVALAIVAELKAVLSSRPGGPSRERLGPLHQRTQWPFDQTPIQADCILCST